MRENLDIAGVKPDLDEASRNLIFFLVNAKGSKELRDDFESRLPSEEAKKEFQKFIKAIQENLDKLGFFESGNPKEIQNDLELSCQRAINKEIPEPERRVELSAYGGSYNPEELTVQDDKFFGSLDRNTQSILMSCAIILSAVNAINHAKQNSTDQPQIYSKILRPLVEYSQQKKGPQEKKISWTFDSIFNKPKPGVSFVGAALNAINHSWTFDSIFNKPKPGVSLVGAAFNALQVFPSYTYLAEYKALDLRILSLGVVLGEIACGVIGYKMNDKNFSTSFSKLMRNQTALMATAALIYSGQILSKGDLKENEKNNLFPDSVLAAHYINLVLCLALILPKNRIKDFYENVDKRFDENFDENFDKMMYKIRASFLPSLKLPTREQELFWSKFLSKDKEKNEEIDSSQQSPKSSPRTRRVNKTAQARDEIQPAR